MFSQIKLAIAIAVVVALVALYGYVQSLRADLATSEANNAALTTAVEQQRQAIEQIQRDVKETQKINRELDIATKLQNKDVDNLREKLQNRSDANGNKVTLGGLAAKKAGLIERKVNQGTDNAFRCMEIASGSPLTEKETNATKKSEINPECPALANPNYHP